MAAPGIVARQVASTSRAAVATTAPVVPVPTTAVIPTIPPVSTTPIPTPTPTQATVVTTTDESIVATPTPTPTPTQAQATTSAIITQSPSRSAAAGPGTTVISSISTDSNGQAITVVVTQTNSGAPTSSATPSSTAAPATASGGLGTGSIIGLSVAGGITVIGIIGFFVWKFTRKRFSDFDDTEAIKWPELNTAHGGTDNTHPLPLNNTGRAGFETGSEANLSRAPSGYANSIATASVPEYNTSDPYAVPPLPHLNPGQPYRDDPSTNAYYDPYRGPIPNTFNEADQGWAPDAIPMTQMAGRRSPGPQMAYETGRGSPAPIGVQMAYETGGYGQANAYGGGGPERRQSPGPAQAYLGRQSPGPGVLYGRQSPGPQAAYR